jgi:hypothetical protein
VPDKPFFVIKDIPRDPMLLAVTGRAIGTVEGCNLKIELVQRLNIATQNDTADALKVFNANAESRTARKAIADDLCATVFKERYTPRLIIASGASKDVPGSGR